MAKSALARWLLTVEVGMPASLQNKSWKLMRTRALELGVKHDLLVQHHINAWVWGTVLPAMQPLANRDENGDEWRRMISLGSADSAKYNDPRLRGIVRDLLECSLPTYGPPLCHAAQDLAWLQRTVPMKIWGKKFRVLQQLSELLHLAEHGYLPDQPLGPGTPTPQEP